MRSGLAAGPRVPIFRLVSTSKDQRPRPPGPSDGATGGRTVESRPRDTAPAEARSHDVAAFLDRAKAIAPAPQGSRGRLMFALDATMSRQPTWDRACDIQAGMFAAAGAVGGLDVQLVYFRGFGECRASQWVSQSARLGALMGRIDCRGGRTQIAKVLAKAIEETRRAPVQALVYIGDAMEEDADWLATRAGELGLLKVPIFVFQERAEPMATLAFRDIARLSGGAHLSFNDCASAELAKLLRAVAVYAAGGRKALEDQSRAGDEGARLLLQKLS